MLAPRPVERRPRRRLLRRRAGRRAARRAHPPPGPRAPGGRRRGRRAPRAGPRRRALGHHVGHQPDLAQRRRRAGPDRGAPSRPARARASPPSRSSSSRGRVRRGDADHVVVPSRRRPARRSARCGSSGTRPPRRRARAAAPRGALAWARARVTTIVRPCSGRRSAQAICSAQRRHGADHGDRRRAIPLAAATAARSASGARDGALRGQRAEATTAAGVARILARPPSARSRSPRAGRRP